MSNVIKASQDDWHSRECADVLADLRSDVQGLSRQTAAERSRDHGLNTLPQPPRQGLMVRFLLHFHNVLIYVLLASAAVTALLGHWVDTVVILAVVLLNAVIGLVQEGKAEKAMDAIRHMLAPTAAVIRDGKRQSVPAESLVPGDVVLLESGDRVPADLRLFKARGLSIQEAILTGESVPVEKGVAAVAPGAVLGDRSCMAFSGTLVTAGQGQGVVVVSGANTELGRISSMLTRVEALTTPLVRQMSVFSRWLTVFILTLAGLILAFGHFVQGQDFS